MGSVISRRIHLAGFSSRAGVSGGTAMSDEVFCSWHAWDLNLSLGVKDMTRSSTRTWPVLPGRLATALLNKKHAFSRRASLSRVGHAFIPPQCVT